MFTIANLNQSKKQFSESEKSLEKLLSAYKEAALILKVLPSSLIIHIASFLLSDCSSDESNKYNNALYLLFKQKIYYRDISTEGGYAQIPFKQQHAINFTLPSTQQMQRHFDLAIDTQLYRLASLMLLLPKNSFIVNQAHLDCFLSSRPFTTIKLHDDDEYLFTTVKYFDAHLYNSKEKLSELIKKFINHGVIITANQLSSRLATSNYIVMATLLQYLEPELIALTYVRMMTSPDQYTELDNIPYKTIPEYKDVQMIAGRAMAQCLTLNQACDLLTYCQSDRLYGRYNVILSTLEIIKSAYTEEKTTPEDSLGAYHQEIAALAFSHTKSQTESNQPANTALDNEISTLCRGSR